MARPESDEDEIRREVYAIASRYKNNPGLVAVAFGEVLVALANVPGHNPSVIECGECGKAVITISDCGHWKSKEVGDGET